MRLLTLATAWLIGFGTIFGGENSPRALILGDSIYQQPTAAAASILKGRVEVVFRNIQPGEVRNTGTALERLDEWLGGEKWDLIHFNFGLGDLVYRAPGMKSFRVLPKEAGGIRATSPEQYEKNLHELVMRLKATRAKLIWAHTTPIRSSSNGILEVGSAVEYNTIAARVMAKHDVPINDLHAHVTSLVEKMSRPPGGDAFGFKATPIDPPIVRSILRELDLIRPVNGPVKVFIMAGGSAHIGGAIVVDSNKPRPGSAKGTLDELVLNEKTAAEYRHLLDKSGNWTTRPDVWIQFDRRGPKSGTLGIGYGGNYKRGIGSELALGQVLGDHFSEQVCLIKTTLGTPALAKELRPPGSGAAGTSFTTLVKQVRDSLDGFQSKFPDYTEEAGYEISGLILNLGEQDADAKIFADYLPILISDLRKEFAEPDLPVVMVGTGRGGYEKTDFPEIIRAQQSVATLPQFKGTVRYVETRDFWPPEDARDAYRHPSHERWYDNALSFYQMGKAVGETVLDLLK